MTIIATTRLTRRFGARTAVDRLTIDLPSGGVIGLVGPNGSGKSTLIRMLLGLIRPSAGSATVFGLPIGAPSHYAERVGALIESPAFVPALSARANLTSLAQLRGLDASRVDVVLAVVGLTGRDREQVTTFSLGMKQRLGIAAALLPDPELLILDEPTNGLDPAGISEIRGLLRTLAAEGRTILVSSHLLAQIEAACDYLVVLRFGELLFAGSMTDMLARTSEHIDARPELDADIERLAQALVAAGFDATAGPDGVAVAAGRDRAASVNRTAAAAGIALSLLLPRSDGLEEVFLRMTGERDGDLDAAPATRPEVH